MLIRLLLPYCFCYTQARWTNLQIGWQGYVIFNKTLYTNLQTPIARFYNFGESIGRDYNWGSLYWSALFCKIIHYLSLEYNGLRRRLWVWKSWVEEGLYPGDGRGGLLNRIVEGRESGGGLWTESYGILITVSNGERALSLRCKALFTKSLFS